METILSISGKPGLYKLVSRGKANLIVETLEEPARRMPVFASDRVTSLADIAMYTNEDDVPLWQVFANVGKKKRITKRLLSIIRSVRAKTFVCILLKYCLTMTKIACMTVT